MYANVIYLKKQLAKRREQKLYEIKPIGSAIRFRRKEMNLTLEEACEGICSVSYMSKLENNLIEPGDQFIDALLDRFSLHESIDADLEQYEKDKIELTHHLLFEKYLTEEITINYQPRDDHQALLMMMGYYALSKNEVEAFNCYGHLRQYISNMKDDELNLFFMILSEMLYQKHRFSEAFDVLSLAPYLDESFLNLNLIKMKLKLKNAFKMHKVSEIMNHYTVYVNILVELEHYQLLKKVRGEFIKYEAYYQLPEVIKKTANQMHMLTEEEKDFVYSKSLFFQQEYEQFMKTAIKYYKFHSHWLLLYLIALDTLKRKEELTLIMSQRNELNDICLGSGLILNHLNQKYCGTKESLLLYLRRDILGYKHISDDYHVLDYLMVDSQHLFSKYQFYKEAVSVTSKYLPRLKMLKQAERV
jgi:transcriptional regulator with XRE-family HTH domain